MGERVLPSSTTLLALLRKGLSIKQVAEQYHVTTGAVYNSLARESINVRSMHLKRKVAPRKLPDKATIIFFRKLGFSLSQIGGFYGTTKQAVHYALKREE